MLNLDDALAERCIDEAAALDPRPSVIAFTGGEPLMYPDRLERLLDRCDRLGLSTRVVTSGFWAKNKASGTKLLYRMRFAGLDALCFSGDKYHLEFLKPSVFRDAIDIAWEVGLPVFVNLVINGDGDPIEQFSSLYGIDRDKIQMCREREFREEIANGRTPDGLMTKVNLSVGRLVGLGRAAQFPEEHFLSRIDEFARLPCDEVVNRPVVYPDGTLQACCCAGGKLRTFDVGNLRDQPLAALIAVMQGRTHFRFINEFGPRALFEVMSEMEPGRLDRSKPYASICDVCVGATCGKEPQRVDSLLDQWRLKQLLAAPNDAATSGSICQLAELTTTGAPTRSVRA